MRRNNVRWAVLSLVLALVYSAVVFLAPFQRNLIFWTSYIFTLLAILVQALGNLWAFSKGKNLRSKFYRLPVAYVGVLYIFVQLVAGLVFMLFSAILPYWLPAIIFFVLLGVAAIGLISSETAHDELEHQNFSHRVATSLMKELGVSVSNLAGETADSALKSELAKLAETFRYSDPSSVPAIKGIEADLSACITDLRQCVKEGKPAATQELIKKASALLAERNRLCKLNK